jgi:hypothetical protein
MVRVCVEMHKWTLHLLHSLGKTLRREILDYHFSSSLRPFIKTHPKIRFHAALSPKLECERELLLLYILYFSWMHMNWTHAESLMVRSHMAFWIVHCPKLQFKVIGVEIMVIQVIILYRIYITENFTGQVAQILNHFQLSYKLSNNAIYLWRKQLFFTS